MSSYEQVGLWFYLFIFLSTCHDLIFLFDGYRGCNPLIKVISTSCLLLNHTKSLLSRYTLFLPFLVFLCTCLFLLPLFLVFNFRCRARRLTSPLQSSSRTGILTQRCSRLVHLLLFSVCHGKLNLSMCYAFHTKQKP